MTPQKQTADSETTMETITSQQIDLIIAFLQSQNLDYIDTLKSTLKNMIDLAGTVLSENGASTKDLKKFVKDLLKRIRQTFKNLLTLPELLEFIEDSTNIKSGEEVEKDKLVKMNYKEQVIYFITKLTTIRKLKDRADQLQIAIVILQQNGASLNELGRFGVELIEKLLEMEVSNKAILQVINIIREYALIYLLSDEQINITIFVLCHILTDVNTQENIRRLGLLNQIIGTLDRFIQFQPDQKQLTLFISAIIKKLHSKLDSRYSGDQAATATKLKVIFRDEFLNACKVLQISI